MGPDRACAEWLLKNGAAVKWHKSDKFLKDYNSMPVSGIRSLKIQAVDATNSSIMHIGFPYFNDLEHFDKLILNNCAYIEDPSLISLSRICREQLTWLEIVQCKSVTEKGLLALANFERLKRLHIEDLKYVTDENAKIVIEELKKALPNCHLTFPPYLSDDIEE